jgi:hypothetical protein
LELTVEKITSLHMALARVPDISNPDVLTDDTDIFSACRYVSTKMSAIPGIADAMSRVAPKFMNLGVYTMRDMRNTNFTNDQIDAFLVESGLPHFRPTLEMLWNLNFEPPRPASAELQRQHEEVMAYSDRKAGFLRPSKYMDPDELTLGEHLLKTRALHDVTLSPRLHEIVNCPTNPSLKDVRAIAAEMVIFTLVKYGRVNVDTIYENKVAGLLDKKYGQLPKNKSWSIVLHNKFVNSRSKDTVYATRPLCARLRLSPAVSRVRGRYLAPCHWWTLTPGPRRSSSSASQSRSTSARSPSTKSTTTRCVRTTCGATATFGRVRRRDHTTRTSTATPASLPRVACR